MIFLENFIWNDFLILVYGTLLCKNLPISNIKRSFMRIMVHIQCPIHFPGIFFLGKKTNLFMLHWVSTPFLLVIILFEVPARQLISLFFWDYPCFDFGLFDFGKKQLPKTPTIRFSTK